jgi:hypothetical protein
MSYNNQRDGYGVNLIIQPGKWLWPAAKQRRKRLLAAAKQLRGLGYGYSSQ